MFGCMFVCCEQIKNKLLLNDYYNLPPIPDRCVWYNSLYSTITSSTIKENY